MHDHKLRINLALIFYECRETFVYICVGPTWHIIALRIYGSFTYINRFLHFKHSNVTDHIMPCIFNISIRAYCITFIGMKWSRKIVLSQVTPLNLYDVMCFVFICSG